MPCEVCLSPDMVKGMRRGDSMHFQRDNMALAVWKDRKAVKVLYNHISPLTAPSLIIRVRSGGERKATVCPIAVSLRNYFYKSKIKCGCAGSTSLFLPDW
jgi:hypothetical protein